MGKQTQWPLVVARYAQRHAKVHPDPPATLPAEWPPAGWESELMPANDSLDAAREWTEYHAEVCRMGDHGARKLNLADVVRDVARLLDQMKARHNLVGLPPQFILKREYLPIDALQALNEASDWLQPKAPKNQPPNATHSDDFRSVKWFGTVYEFGKNPAACVKVLWEHWERGTPAVSDSHVLEAADVSSERLDLVFRQHPAWGTMIVPGGTRGTHQLQRPKK